MFEPFHREIASPRGAVDVRAVSPTIIESVYTGHCSKSLVQSVLDVTDRLLASVPELRLLLDMSRVTHVDIDTRAPGMAIFGKLIPRGKAFALVVGDVPARMIITAIAFGMGIPLRVFDDRAAALRYLQTDVLKRSARHGRWG